MQQRTLKHTCITSHVIDPNTEPFNYFLVFVISNFPFMSKSLINKTNRKFDFVLPSFKPCRTRYEPINYGISNY